MRRLCKNCESFAVKEDGVKVCTYLNVARDETSNPPPESSCWKRKARLSGIELSAKRSECGRKGGRPKGTGKGRAPTKQASLRLLDHTVLMAYAQMKNLPLVDAIHRLCKSLIKQYPQLKPDGWAE